MSFLRWFTRNWADTDEPGDPGLGPLELPVPLPDALQRVQTAIRNLPHWQVETVDAGSALVKATRRTRLWRFVDDVSIRLEPAAGATRVHARSKSRVGVGDLGQNRRNLLQLFTALKRL
jgi:uncharacterized protein (DUF1499 family)